MRFAPCAGALIALVLCSEGPGGLKVLGQAKPVREKKPEEKKPDAKSQKPPDKKPEEKKPEDKPKPPQDAVANGDVRFGASSADFGGVL